MRRSDYSAIEDGRVAIDRGLGVGRRFQIRKSELFSYINAVLYALVISGYPLISNIPLLLSIQSRPFTVSLHAMIALLSVIVLTFVGIKRKQIYQGLLWVPLAAFWILYLGRITADTVVMQLSLGRPHSEYFVFAIATCLVPMLAFLVRVNSRTLQRAFELTSFVTLLAALLALFNLLAFQSPSGSGLWAGRLGAEVLNPISLGHLGATLTILSSYKLINGNYFARIPQLLVLGTAFLGLATVLLAASKGPVLALAAAETVIFWSACVRKRVKKRTIAMTGILFSLLAVLALHFASRYGSSLILRFSLLYSGQDAGVGTRLDLLSEAWRLFLEHPLFGGALELADYASYPHNVLVESYMATGLLGGTAFTVLMLMSVFYALHLRRQGVEYSWVGLLYIQYLVGAMVSGSLYQSSAMWSMMGAVISLYRVRTHRWAVGLVPLGERRN